MCTWTAAPLPVHPSLVYSYRSESIDQQKSGRNATLEISDQPRHTLVDLLVLEEERAGQGPWVLLLIAPDAPAIACSLMTAGGVP